jgi:protocatechuate 3,4-dioxygenase alpha subunit
MENSAKKDSEKPDRGDAIVFRDFRLVPATRTLTRSGSPVHLGARALDILIALIDRAGQVVSNEELFSVVWPNTFIEESNLRVHIAALRKALGDGQLGTRFILSVPRRGYMFIAKIERTSADESAVGSLRKNRSGYQSDFPIPLVRIVGRGEEVSELSEKLLSKRFVTITGTGGVGKTVVALTVAQTLQGKFRDGARLVDLASLSSPAMVAAHLGMMLHLATPEEDLLQHLVAYLATRNMLIVLDNCERVIDEVARIAEAIFQRAPEAHILATSREPLRATGEWVLRLAPLAAPPVLSEMTAADALRFPSVQLFAEYAGAGEMSYQISDSDAPIVAQTCAKLDPALFGQTPSQTVGPYFHYGLPWKGGADLVGKSDMGARTDLFPAEHYVLNVSSPTGTPQGDHIEIIGRVLDGEERPVADAMIEIWQANAAGCYASADDNRVDLPLDPHFVGFGRAATDQDGVYRFRTVRPGRVPGPGNSLQAPHLAVSVFGRGLLKRLATRLYFADEASNAIDPILSLVPDERRHTLIAERSRNGTWMFDIVLQGKRETVFFDL